MKKHQFVCFLLVGMTIGTVHFAFAGQEGSSMQNEVQERKEESFDYNAEVEKRKNQICHILGTRGFVVSYDFDTKDTEEVERYLRKKIDTKFSTDYFQMERKENVEKQETILTYSFYMNQQKTYVSYEVFAKKGYVSRIYTKGCPVYPPKEEDGLDGISVPEQEIKQKIAEVSQWPKKGFKIESQYVIYQRDRGTYLPYATILSNYKHPETKETMSDTYCYFPQQDSSEEEKIVKMELTSEKECLKETHMRRDGMLSYQFYYTDLKYNIKKEDTQEIETYIKENIDKKFDLSYYKKEIDTSDDGQFASIRYILYIDGKETDIYYSIWAGEDEKIGMILLQGDPAYPDGKGYQIPSGITEEEIKKAALEDSQWVEEGYRVTDQILFVNWSEKGNCPYAVVITNFDAPPMIQQFPNQLVSETYRYYFD